MARKSIPPQDRLRFDNAGVLTEKWCSTHDGGAGAWLHVSSFAPDPRSAGGLHYKCRACRNIQAAAQRDARLGSNPPRRRFADRSVDLEILALREEERARKVERAARRAERLH